MPAPVREPVLAMVGLGVVAFLCVQLLRGAVTLEAAAVRTITLTLILTVADRVLVPIGRALICEPRRDARVAAQVTPSRPEEEEA